MATIAKKCSVCGALYRAYNYVDIPVSRDDDDDGQEYDDDEAIDVEVEEDFEPINFEPNGFEFVTIKEDMDIQYDFENQDLCPECMEVISNFIETNTPHASGNPVVLEDAAPGTPIEMVVDIQPSQDLHGYDHPWVGGAGKNIYPIAIGRDRFIDNLGATHTTDNDTLTVTFTTTEASCGVYSPSASSVRSVFASLSGTYTYSFDVKVNVASARVLIGVEGNGARAFDLTNSWQRLSITADFSSTASSFVVYNNGRSSGVVVDIKNLQIEQGSTATSYAPYENICPITGYDEVNVTRTGVNLLPIQTRGGTNYGFTWRINEDGSIFLNGTASTSNTYTYVPIYGENTINVEILSDYPLPKGLAEGDNIFLKVFCNDPIPTGVVFGTQYNKADGSLAGQRITELSSVPIGSKYFFAFVRVADGTQCNNLLLKPMLAKSDTALPYEPYQSQTVTVTLNDTTYGGTLNVTTGELIVDRAFYTWSSGGTLTSTKAFSLSKSDVVQINASNQTTLKGAICDKMQSGTWQQISNPNATSMYAGCAWGTALAFRVPGYTTAEEYLTFLAENPLQFAYLLKEPQTIHLTPAQIRLLKGSNTIETDAGTISIKYKKAIEGKMEVES